MVLWCSPCCCKRARAWTMARNSPMLLVPFMGPKWKTRSPSAGRWPDTPWGRDCPSRLHPQPTRLPLLRGVRAVRCRCGSREGSAYSQALSFHFTLSLSQHAETWSLHSLRHFDAQQGHAVLDDLGHVAGNDQTRLLLALVLLVEDGVVVVELVEHLGQLVAVVGNAAG